MLMSVKMIDVNTIKLMMMMMINVPHIDVCCRRLSGVAQDYLHGKFLGKFGRTLVLVMSISAFGSLCYFNYADVGFSNAVRMIYSQL